MDMVLQTLSNLATFIFVASVKATVLIALVLLAQKAFSRFLSAGVHYVLWFPVVLALITPVGVNLTLPAGLMPAIAPAVTSVDADSARLPALTSVQARTDAGGSVSSAPASASTLADTVVTDAGRVFLWLHLLVDVWLAGVLVVLGAVAASCHRFSRTVSRATPAPEELQLCLKDCMAQTSCTIPVNVLLSADVQVPMIAGLFKPALLLPTGMDQQLARAQLRHVFIHELMHLQRGDIACNWIVALVQALHWFNPAVWFAFYCMRQDRELACDAATLRHLAPADRVTYGHTLLQLNDVSPRTPVPAVALGILESPSHLHRRIRMLVQISRPRKLQSFLAPVLLLPLAAVAISQPAPAAAPQVVVTESAALAEPTLNPATPATPVVAPPVSAAQFAPRPALPVTGDMPVEQVQPVTEAVRQTEPVAVEVPLLAQIDTAPVVDPFAVAAEESTNVIAAVTTAQPQATAEPATDIPRVVLQMAEEIGALKTGQLSVIEEWNANAVACEARKESALFGTLSKPCREVRVVQIRGDVFRFVYGCHVLGVQQTAQWAAWREAVAQQRPGMSVVEEALRANEQELAELCDMATYANAYPGYNKMLADAVALKYYNPWRRPDTSSTYVPSPYSSTYDPLYLSRLSDTPPF